MNQPHIISTAAVLAAVLFFSSCSDGEKSKTLAESKGLPSELLLVVDKDLWETDLQDSVKLISEAYVPGLPQAEKTFRVTQIFSNFYDRSFFTFHSKLFVHVDPALKKSVIGVNRNVHARPQIEVTVSAPSLDDLRECLSRNSESLVELITDAQIEMRMSSLRKYSKRVDDDLRKTLSMSIRVPENIVATKKGENFLWAGSNLQQKDLNVVVYTYPWSGGERLTEEILVSKRDSIMQVNIPGASDGQWMQTTCIDGAPVVLSRLKDINGKSMLEVRGLWEMRGAALGGPFVCLARIDSAKHRVVVAEGFVYSPSTDKRELVRTLEASLRTLKDVNL